MPAVLPDLAGGGHSRKCVAGKRIKTHSIGERKERTLAGAGFCRFRRDFSPTVASKKETAPAILAGAVVGLESIRSRSILMDQYLSWPGKYSWPARVTSAEKTRAVTSPPMTFTAPSPKTTFAPPGWKA